jgi:hypothetical protein
MLRLFVLLLALLNAGYFAWSAGLLRDWGFAPQQQSEPQRLQQQIKPQALRLLSPEETRRQEAAVPPPKAPECLMAGLFDDQQVPGLRGALEKNLPEGSWSLESAVEPARWIVYMGTYANADAVARKKQELRQFGVPFEALTKSSLEPGLSLGGHPTQAAANAAMADLSKRGVRTARVVQERAEQRGQMLRLASVDEALRGRLEALKPQLGDKPLHSCKTP